MIFEDLVFYEDIDDLYNLFLSEKSGLSNGSVKIIKDDSCCRVILSAGDKKKLQSYKTTFLNKVEIYKKIKDI